MNTETRKTIRDYVNERGITATTQHVGRAIGDNWGKDHHEYAVTLALPSGASIRASYKCNPLVHMDKHAMHRLIPIYMRATAKRYVGPGRGTRSLDQAAYDKLIEHHAPGGFVADAGDVLDCLLRDAQGTDEPFESWASDLGYDTDSRKAEAVFHACRETAAKLRRWIGPVELERVVQEYESL